MGIAVDGAELTGESRLRGIRKVEDEALTRPETIGEQPPVRRHFMLGVMRPVGAPRDWQRRHQPSVARTALGDVEHGKKVRLRNVV